MPDRLSQFIDSRELRVDKEISPRGTAELIRGLQVLLIPEMSLGAAGFPDSTSVDTADITASSLSQVLNYYPSGTLGMPLARFRSRETLPAGASGDELTQALFGVSNDAYLAKVFAKIAAPDFNYDFGPELLTLREPYRLSEYTPAVSAQGSIYEAVFVSWDGKVKSWKWVVAQTKGEKVSVHNWDTRRLLAEISHPKDVPFSFYDEIPLIPDDVGSVETRQALTWTIGQARHLPVGAASLMIISNANPQINGERSQVAANLWRILNSISANVGTQTPNLICNGFKENITQMRAIASASGVDPNYIQAVELPHPATTMDHGIQMQVQLPALPDSCVIVTSSEHLLRTALHLIQQLGTSGTRIGVFEAPSHITPLDARIRHEITTLDKYLPEVISQKKIGQETGWWDRYIPPTKKSIWARVSAGWQIDTTRLIV